MKYINKNVLGNYIYLNTERFLGLFSSLLITGLHSRVLDVDIFGLWQFTLVVIFIFSSFTFICGAEIALPKLSECENLEQESELISDIFTIRIVFSFVVYLFFCIYFLIKFENFWFLLLGASIAFKEAFSIAISWFQIKGAIKVYSLISIKFILLKTLATIFLWFLGVSNYVYYVIIIFIDAILVNLFIFRKFISISHVQLRLKIKKNDLKRLSEFFLKCLPFGLSVIFMVAAQRIDRFLLEYFVPKSEFAVYAVAMQIIENLMVFSSLLIVILAPKFVYNIKFKSNREIILVIFKISVLLFIFNLLIVALFLIFGQAVIHFIYGDSYVRAYHFAKPMLLALLFFGLDLCASVFFVKKSLGFYMLIKWMISLIGSIFIFYIYFQSNIFDAAIASVTACYALAFIVSILFMTKFTFCKKLENENTSSI